MSTEPGEIEYADSWNARRGRIGVPLTEAEARARDAAGDVFMAVLRRPHSRWPELVEVSWETGCITVQFLDRHGRQNLQYWFFKVDDERMFLRNVTYWEYPDDNPRRDVNEATKIETLAYREDGYVKRIVTDDIEHVKETVEYDSVPVESNWEPVPAFGDYWSIARRERRVDR